MAHRQKHRDAAAARRRTAGIRGARADLVQIDETAATDRPPAHDPLDVSAYAGAILRGLQAKPVYTGPVPDHLRRGRRLSEPVIAHRRVRGRIAKRSRKRNRRKRSNLPALLWLYVAMLISGSAFGLSVAPPAEALTYGAPLQVTVTWVGGDCWTRGGTKPADHDPRVVSLFIVPGCHDTATDTQFATPGQYFGADPDIGDAFAVACTVTNTANDAVVATDYARHGDGHDANCLRRWA